MWKSMLAGAVALAVAGASAAFAQQRPEEGRPPAQASPAPQSSPQPGAPAQGASAQPESGAQSVAEGRLAQLRARLSLTQDQEKNWSAFEQAYRDFARLRSERWRDLSAQRRSDNPVENFQMWTDFMSRRVNGMKRLADAAVPLYQSLDQNQQRRFVDQIYAWHPRLARVSERLSARGGSDDEGGWRSGPRAGWQGCEGRFGYGMGPRWGWRDRDDRGGYDRGCGRGMCPRWGSRGHDNDWDEDHGGYERGPHYGMGPHGGWRDGDWDEDKGGYERGPHYGMGPRGGWRDRDELYGSRGDWNGPQDWRDRGSGPNEERF